MQSKQDLTERDWCDEHALTRYLSSASVKELRQLAYATKEALSIYLRRLDWKDGYGVCQMEANMAILRMLGLSPSEEDKKLKQLVENSYTSVRVVGRGTVKIDPKEVRTTQEFKKAREDAKAIVGA